MKTGRPRKAVEEYVKCKAEGCTRVTRGGAKGFCHSHYIAFTRGHVTEAGVWTRPSSAARGRLGNHLYEGATCVGPRCGFAAKVKGFCRKHYKQFMAGILNEEGKQIRPKFPWQRKRTKERWVEPHGYVLVYAPVGHPRARHDGTMFEHRLVMEQVLGRYLEPHELVHHKNGNRSDNSPENLMLMDGRAKKGEGHPPGSEMDAATAAQVLIQRDDLPEEVRAALRQLQPQLKKL